MYSYKYIVNVIIVLILIIIISIITITSYLVVSPACFLLLWFRTLVMFLMILSPLPSSLALSLLSLLFLR